MKIQDTLDTDVLEQYHQRQSRRWLAITSAFLLLAVLASIIFVDKSGKDLLSWKDNVFRVNLPDGSSYSVPFEQIDSLTLIDGPDFGTCLSGNGEKTLKYGIWENETLGSYVLCAYRCYDCVIQVQTKDQVFWISYESPETTALLFENFAREITTAKNALGA